MTVNVLSQFEADLVAFFTNAETKFEEFAAAFLPKVESAIEVGLEDLAAIAGKAVLSQANAVLSGSEKFGNAVANVVQTVEASGKTVAIQTAQTAVQSAYEVAVQVAQSKN